MKPQTKLAAFWEAWQSTIIGFVLAWASTLLIMPVCVRLWGIALGGTAFTLWMTALSLLRQWLVRLWHERRGRRASPPDFLPIMDEIAAERWRQISGEGFSLNHDDTLVYRQLAHGAAAYAIAGGLAGEEYRELQRHGPRSRVADVLRIYKLWAWQDRLFKPTSQRRDLIKAAAMIVAEIGRLDRAVKRSAP